MMSRSYVMLRTHPDDESVFEAMYPVLNELALRHGLAFRYGSVEQPAEDMVRHVYHEQSSRAELSLVNDWRAQAQYITVEAADANLAQAIASTVAERLPSWTLDALRADAEMRMDEEPEALVRLALAAGEHAEPEVAALIERAAAAEDDLIRFRAAEAAAITGWPRFADVFRPLAAGDSSPEVREMAGHAVAAATRTGAFGRGGV